MNKLLVCLGLFVLAVRAFAEVGVLTPVTCDQSDMLFSSSIMVMNWDWMPAPDGCGTVHPNACVARFSHPTKMSIAFDADDAKAAHLNLLRFDFTGQNKFGNDCVVKLKDEGGQKGDRVCSFAGRFKVQSDGQEIPVDISGEYMTSGNFSTLFVYPMYGVEGECAFGDKTHRVRLIACDGNFQLPTACDISNRTVGLPEGNSLEVFNSNSEIKPIQTLYGQPVQVDGKWYTVTVSPDAKTVSAAPFTGETGVLKFPHANWEANLVGSKYFLSLSSKTPEVTIPADQYRVYEFTEHGQSSKSDDNSLDIVNSDAFEGKGAVMTVQPGAVKSVAIGSPLTAKVQVTQKDGVTTFSLLLRDCAGNEVQGITLGGNSVIDKVKFQVVNAKGVKVYENTFEHG